MFLKKLTYSTWCLLALAVILMFVINNNVGKQNEYDWEQQLEQAGVKNTIIIEEQLKRVEQELMGVVSLFEASEAVSRSGFKTYVTPILKKNRFIKSFQWIPRVRRDQRPLLETMAQRDGFPDFQFNTLNKDSSVIPAPLKNEYFPIYYVEPYFSNEPALGFDVSSQPNLLNYINQAKASGNTITTNTMLLNQSDAKLMETLIFSPFYSGEGIPKTVEDRDRLFMGVVVGAYNTNNMIKQIISPYLSPGIFLTVLDNEQKNKIYGNLKEDYLIEIKKETSLSFSEIHWFLVWQANLEFQKGPNRLQYWLSAAVLALIVFIAVIFQMLASRTRRVENEVRLRTNELNKLKNELEKKNLSLHELIEMKNELLGMASHDLRNPLTSIQGYSEFLLKKGDALSEDTRTDFLKIINTASVNILGLLNDLLNLSAIESGRLALNLQPGNLRELIEERVHLYTHLALEKKIKLEVDCQNIPLLLFDAPRIGQVLDNLLTNAIKFSPLGGKIQLTSESGNGFVRVSVIDEGPGIKDEELENLFQPFKKLSSNPTGKEKGAGLGLAIAKKMVELHHGALTLKPSKDHGTSFIFELPIKPATPKL